MVPKFVLIFGPSILKEKAGHRSLTFWKLGTKSLRSHREKAGHRSLRSLTFWKLSTKSLRSHREEEQAFYLHKRRLSNNQSSTHRNPTPQSKQSKSQAKLSWSSALNLLPIWVQSAVNWSKINGIPNLYPTVSVVQKQSGVSGSESRLFLQGIRQW
jgi:hypothetical protein